MKAKLKLTCQSSSERISLRSGVDLVSLGFAIDTEGVEVGTELLGFVAVEFDVLKEIPEGNDGTDDEFDVDIEAIGRIETPGVELNIGAPSASKLEFR